MKIWNHVHHCRMLSDIWSLVHVWHSFFGLGKCLHSGFPNFSTIEIWGQIILRCGVPSLCIAGISEQPWSLDTSSIPSVVTTKKCLHALPNVPWGCKIAPVEDYCLNCFEFSFLPQLKSLHFAKRTLSLGSNIQCVQNHLAPFLIKLHFLNWSFHPASCLYPGSC